MPNRRPGEEPTLPDENVNDYINKAGFRYFKDSALFDVLTTAWREKKDEDLQKISVIFNNLREYFDTYVELEDAYFRHYFAYYKHAKVVYNEIYDKENDNWTVESNFEETLFVNCGEIEDGRYASSKRAREVCKQASKFENARQQVVAFDNMFNTLLSQIEMSYPVYSKELVSPIEMQIRNDADEIVPLLSDIKFNQSGESLNLWQEDPTPETELTEDDVIQILNEQQDKSEGLQSNILSKEKVSSLISNALSLLVWENKKLFFYGSTGYNVGLAMSQTAHNYWSLENSLSPVNFNKVDGCDLRSFWLQEDELKTMFLRAQSTPFFHAEGGPEGGKGFAASADFRNMFQLGQSLTKGFKGYKQLKEQVFNDYESYGISYIEHTLNPLWEADVIPNVVYAQEGKLATSFSYGSHLVGHHLDALTMATGKQEFGINLHQAYNAEYSKYWNTVLGTGNWLEKEIQQEYLETIPNFQTFLQTVFGEENITFFDMENISHHPQIADFWTGQWHRPFVVKRRNDWYRKMWKDNPPHSRSAAKKFWEFADLGHEPFNVSGPIINPPGKMRSTMVLDHVAWYYPRLAAVIAEIIYKVYNIKLHTTCIDVKEEKIYNSPQWAVTINIKHMSDGYKDMIYYPELEYEEGYVENNPEYFNNMDMSPSKAKDRITFKKKGYDFQPKVKYFKPVQFTVNKIALRNDLKERNFVFD